MRLHYTLEFSHLYLIVVQILENNYFALIPMEYKIQ